MKQRKGLGIITNIDGFSIIAQLYDTKIFKQKGNEITLNSGGFRTTHTKNCINDLLPSNFRLYQKKGNWYLETPETTLDFSDNMTFNI